ncbi:hypothetical protein MTO96_028604 [Rhipicephalus appendiculatus]
MTSAGDVTSDGTASLARQLAVFLENRRRPNRNEKRTVDPSEHVDEPQAKRINTPTDSYGCVAWQPECEGLESLEEKRCLLSQSGLSSEEICMLMAQTYPLQRKEINEGRAAGVEQAAVPGKAVALGRAASGRRQQRLPPQALVRCCLWGASRAPAALHVRHFHSSCNKNYLKQLQTFV